MAKANEIPVWEVKYLIKIKEAKTDNDRLRVIEEIYNDGYEDGEKAEEELEREPLFDMHELD